MKNLIDLGQLMAWIQVTTRETVRLELEPGDEPRWVVHLGPIDVRSMSPFDALMSAYGDWMRALGEKKSQ